MLLPLPKSWQKTILITRFLRGLWSLLLRCKDSTTLCCSFLICARIVEQPLKIPFLAAIVFLTNAQKPELAGDVLTRIGDALQQRLDRGLWREVKLYLRFLGCLQGIFSGDGVFTVLEELFSRAADLQMKSSEDVRYCADR